MLGRVLGDASDMQPSCAVLKEHQRVEALAERGVNVEEVCGEVSVVVCQIAGRGQEHVLGRAGSQLDLTGQNP
ncbi:hypothetical protein [Kibdelosporangium aridum]|uniref:hypothetical protein n=1 Tax=Kibdelosporangium aridum TaxID=2030 RepID=UPI001C8BF2BF